MIWTTESPECAGQTQRFVDRFIYFAEFVRIVADSSYFSNDTIAERNCSSRR